jgi:lipoate-protein ligase A
LKTGESTFQIQNKIFLWILKDKQEERTILIIHNAKVISIGKNRKMDEDVKKPHCTIKYNKYMKGINR